MTTSGLVITLSPDPAAAARALATIQARPEFTLAGRQDRWLPLAMEARDDGESRELHDWLHALPGVDYVDVVSVHFEEPERGGDDGAAAPGVGPREPWSRPGGES